MWTQQRKSGSTHCDVEDGNNVERWSENGAHALNRRLIEAVVGW